MKKMLFLWMICALLIGSVAAWAEPAAMQRMEDVDVTQVVVDPANPLGTMLKGWYSVDVAPEEGTTRQIYHYVPERLTYRQPAVAIGIPSGENAVDFVTKTGWLEQADQQGFSLIVMTAAADGWQSSDIAYAQATFAYMDARKWLQMQDSAFYFIGYGDSANVILHEALTQSELLAGCAAFGVDSFDTTLLTEAQDAPSAMEGVSKAEVHLPIWIGAEEKNETVELLISFWKNCNDYPDAEPVSNVFANEIYTFPRYMALDNDMTDQNVAQVRVTIGLKDVLSKEFTNELWNSFLRRTRRQDSEQINSLRAFATNDELGFDYIKLDVDGVTREMYVYVPTQVKTGKVNHVPVVFVYHGGGGSGEEFVNRCGWNKVSEERNFICVFPTGSRSNDKFKASTTWKQSDLPFFVAAREYVLANYAMIDQTRVYVTGHSMGDIMTHYIALYHPELVAAVAPNDALMFDGIASLEGVVNTIAMPYMLNIGTLDYGFLPGGMNDGMVDGEMLAMLARYGNAKKPDETFTYTNGRYYGSVWTDANGLPVAKLQWVEGKIHAMIPEECYSLYDFLSCYTRGEDGSSYFMGQRITIAE